MTGLRGRLRDRGGFSLVELVMAIAVLAIAGVFLSQVFLTADHLATRASSLDRAVSTCTAVAESWKAQPDPTRPTGASFLTGASVAILDGGGFTSTSFLDDAMEPTSESSSTYRREVRAERDGDLVRLTIVISSMKDSKLLYALDAARWAGPAEAGP
jgi:prepilin-type N-terminal cleavage/methylation domain-containing protein